MTRRSVARLVLSATLYSGVALFSSHASAQLRSATVARSEPLVTRVYDLTDMCLEIPTVSNAPSPKGATTGGDNVLRQMADDLKALIKETVASDTWSDVGGVGNVAIVQLPAGGTQLVISQTPKVHEDITRLLSQLREAHAIQISVECRFIAIEQEKLPAAVDLQLQQYQGKKFGVFLTADQVAEIITLSQASDSVLVSAPRITTVNGGSAEVTVTSPFDYIQAYSAEAMANGTRYVPVTGHMEPGLRLAIRANASARRTHVTLYVDARLTSLVSLEPAPWPGNAAAGQTLTVQAPKISKSELETLTSIPDQQTILLSGLAEMTNNGGNTLFRQPSTKPAQEGGADTKWVPVFMLVKPTIIIRDLAAPKAAETLPAR